MTGAGRHHLACPQRQPELAKFVCAPRQRNSGIAEHVPAVADMALAAQRDDGSLLDEIEGPPVRGRWLPEHEQMRAGIVGDDLRLAGADEIGEARIRNLDGWMQ